MCIRDRSSPAWLLAPSLQQQRSAARTAAGIVRRRPRSCATATILPRPRRLCGLRAADRSAARATLCRRDLREDRVSMHAAAGPGDLAAACATGGTTHKSLLDRFRSTTTIPPGVSYSDTRDRFVETVGRQLALGRRPSTTGC